MPSFPGSENAIPGVYNTVTTLSRGVSVAGGIRTAALMGEGARVETLVSSAVGGGNDGLNSTGTSVTGRDGRHFRLSNAPIISNRTTLFKNGVPLVGLEDTVDSSTFDDRFDYRVDITNGMIELQTSALVDQGGAFYLANSLNVGNGTISSLTLTDVNAPTETWTIRCTSVRRDSLGDPIDGYAMFIAQGSVSGLLLDSNGNQIKWQSNGIVVDNGILSFAITEGATTFVEGDKFTVRVAGGVLVNGDSLVVTYIAVADINDPEFFTDINLLRAKHGSASLANTLSLGAQLAFSNSPPGIWALQCAPPVPRRVSYELVESANGTSTIDDLVFNLPLDIIPDTDSNINFFVTDPVTGVETQIIPNRVTFYDATITASPSDFVFGAGYDFSYTVALLSSIQKSGTDGVITPVTGTTGTLSSDTVTFDLDDLDATVSVKIFDATNPQNNGVFPVVSVSNGVITLSNGSGFIAESNIRFEVTDTASTSAQILFTDDLVLTLGQSLRATVVDTKDADFFDVGWISAYESLEKIDTDIIVPLPLQTISAIFANGKQHVIAQSGVKNKHERVLFIGAVQGLNPEHVLGTEQAAVEDLGILEGIQGDEVTEILAGSTEDLTDYSVQNAYGDTFRTVYFYPDQIVVQIGADRTLVDGFYMAAAAAGFLSGVPNIAIPLTNKTISGFTILRDKLFRPITLEQLSAAGITVLQPVTSGGRVIHGKTTTNSGFVEEIEISIIFIRDRIAKATRSAFAGFIGGAESSALQGSLMSRATSVMKGFISSGYITDFRDLKIVRSSVDPTQWDVSVAVQPVYPVNYLYISFSVGLL